MKRSLYLTAGFVSVALGAIGAIVPLLPSVPFFLLAAFCFGRSSPRFENWLLEHRQIGPAIKLWRERGAISLKGKRAATLALGISSAAALWLSPLPWSLVAVTACLLSGAWIWSRPAA